MEGKKFLSPRGMVLCGALLLAAGALCRELSQLAGPETLSLTGENGVEVTITFTPQGAAVTASTCPDQVCVQTGQLTRAGESAICLPARVTLRLEGGGDSVDATVY